MKSKFIAKVSETLQLEKLTDNQTGKEMSPEFIKERGLAKRFLDAIDMVESLNGKLNGRQNSCYVYKKRNGYTVYIYD